MCGICGFNFSDKELIGKMCEIIAHRGPNNQGTYVDDKISLGNRRLSIIDISSKGNQPIVNEKGNLVITYNGELYNFKEIKNDLIKKGYRFNSETDTEVILYAYEEYEKECVKKFNGIFAFAIWDNNKKELFLARDHLGIKPLYYYFKNGKFIFASEIKAILLSKDVKTKINKDVLKEIIACAYPIFGKTLFLDINELKPGHNLTLVNNKINIENYWNPNINEIDESLDYFSNRVRNLLERSVKMQLVSDVPLGVFLSGGLDSSIITAIASKYSQKPVETVTLGFGTEEDEYKYAKIVSEHCKTNHSEIYVNSSDLAKALPKIVWHYEFPFTRPAILAYYFLSNRTKGKLTVSLLGQGADEIFAGYNRYDAYTKLQNNNDYELKQKIEMKFEDKVKYISSGVFNKDDKEFFKDDLLKDKSKIFNQYAQMIKNLKNDGSQLNPTLLYEIKTELPYYQLKMVDKTSMANSHEMRVPILDYELVEFALKIPSKFKFFGNNKKIVLQHAAKDYLPKEILQRRKLPMVVPLSKVFKEDLISIASSVLSINKLKEMGVYKEDSIIKHLEKIKDNTLKDDNSFRQLLFFVTLGLWSDIFINVAITKNINLNLKNYI
ncbi:MAG: asparagine synthase (glutamine-hydrolyzing) [Nanoarchaeota archaeon]